MFFELLVNFDGVKNWPFSAMKCDLMKLKKYLIYKIWSVLLTKVEKLVAYCMDNYIQNKQKDFDSDRIMWLRVITQAN